MGQRTTESTKVESFRTRHHRPILIADDDANTLDGLTEFFNNAGYRVVWARDGQEAMNLLVGGLVPILLIIDIAMPHVAGDELLRYVQADPVLRGVPVLIVTGAPERAGRAVADAIVAKPVDLACLLAQVRRLTADVVTDLTVDGPVSHGRKPRLTAFTLLGKKLARKKRGAPDRVPGR